MLKKLRRRFVLVNMSLVSIVLAIVFIFVYRSTAEQMARDTRLALERALSMPIEGEGPAGAAQPPVEEKGKPKYPILLLKFDADGSLVSEISSLHYSQSDYSELVEAVMKDLPAGSENWGSRPQQGILTQENLRFLSVQGEGGSVRIAFADRSVELSTLNGLLLNSLLIAGISLIVFFIISVFLAHWVVKPVVKAWDQQSEFIANASHELKTPLTVLLADLAILRRHSQNTIIQEEKWISSMENAGEEMSELIKQLLYLARVDAEVDALVKSGSATPKTLTNFSRLVTESILNFEPLAFEYGKHIDSEIEADLHSDFAADEWGKVLGVLLDNALKYSTPETSINVYLKKQNDKQAQLTIVSRGAVIPEDRLPQLFDRFYRLKDPSAPDKGGAGLGLAIAQQIAQKSATCITVTSSLENGTRFSVPIRLKQVKKV